MRMFSETLEKQATQGKIHIAVCAQKQKNAYTVLLRDLESHVYALSSFKNTNLSHCEILRTWPSQLFARIFSHEWTQMLSYCISSI